MEGRTITEMIHPVVPDPARCLRRNRSPNTVTRFQVQIFFFQAEDGIRDLTVTGVQTCALPIYTNAECGMRNAECKCEGRKASHLSLQFRIPHSAFRTLHRMKFPDRLPIPPEVLKIDRKSVV